MREAPAQKWAVVVLGDHGEAFGEHLSSEHATTLYEEALRTALLIRSPNVPPGVHPDWVACRDVPWLTLHAAGIIAGAPPALPYQYAALDIAGLRSLRVGSKKAIWSYNLDVWELYDLDYDPGETRSLAESRPALLAPLRAQLQALSRECPAPKRPL